jgi:hypothetical protein
MQTWACPSGLGADVPAVVFGTPGGCLLGLLPVRGAPGVGSSQARRLHGQLRPSMGMLKPV